MHLQSLYLNFVFLFYHPYHFLTHLKLYVIIATGHGGSDGLHGYVPSLDHVVADTVSIFPLLFIVEIFIIILRTKRTLGFIEFLSFQTLGWC